MDVGEQAETAGETQECAPAFRSAVVNMVTPKENWMLPRQTRKRVRQEPSWRQGTSRESNACKRSALVLWAGAAL